MRAGVAAIGSYTSMHVGSDRNSPWHKEASVSCPGHSVLNLLTLPCQLVVVSFTPG